MKLVLLFLLLSINAFASAPDSLRAELGDLLKKRQELFNEYSSSLSKKSGFFGNKTKNDLRDSQDKLHGIVEADNKIISVLNRTIDFRNYEKLNYSFDATSSSNRIQTLTALNESLLKQNKIYSDDLAGYKSELKRYRLYNVLLIAAFVAGIVFMRVRKMFRS